MCLEYTPYRRQERDQGHIMSSLLESNLGNVLEKIPFVGGLEDGISRMGTGFFKVDNRKYISFLQISRHSWRTHLPDEKWKHH